MSLYRSNWFDTVLFLVLFALFFCSATSARAAIGFEQQINIDDKTYIITASGSAQPLNNDAGLIYYDSSKYSGKTIYFEAVASCTACEGGNAQAKVGLYDSSGNLVTNSTLTTSATTPSRIRSSAITNNLTTETNYTVKTTLDADIGTATLKAARLIIVQSADPITTTQTQIEIGNNTSTSNTNYELITAPKLFHYLAADFAPQPVVYFEASIQSNIAQGTAYAALSTIGDCSSVVPNSEVSLLGTSWDRIRSSTITLANDTTYFVCIKTSAGAVASIANAKIVLDQSNNMGISRATTYQLLINTPVNDSDTTYTAQGFPIQFDASHYSGGIFNHFLEADMMMTGTSGLAHLYDTTNSSAISDSEITVNDSNYTRIRSNDLSTSLPNSPADIDTELKNGGSATTIASASYLVTQYTSYPSLTFSISAVPGNTVTNGITTSSYSEITKLEFGNLVPGHAKYLAHKLTAKSTATSGYTVYAKFLYTLQGLYPANIIEAFPAEWSSPASWYTPTGTTANVNTGWIGANTSDTRVPYWSSASGKFGGISTVGVKVMQSTDIDAGTDAYVTYALEVNDRQPTDAYAGTLVYSVVATY